MIALIICLIVMILFMVSLDGVASYALGDTLRGNRIFSQLLTIGILYLVFVGIIGTGGGNEFLSNGIPFLTLMDKDTTLISILKEHPMTFVTETAELISLIFLISFIERLLPTDNSSLSFMITSRIILVLVGIIVNCFFVSLTKDNEIYQWGLTILQCLISGTSITLTPTIFIGRMLGVSPENPALQYAINQLPGTAVGRAFTEAVSRTAVLMIGIMILEASAAPLFGVINWSIDIVYYIIAPLVITIIGVMLIVRSVFRR